MNTKTVAIAGMIAGIFCWCGNAPAQEKKEGAKPAAQAEMEAPKPGPEMAKLNYLIGSWTLSAEYVKSPMVPEGGKQTGWYKARLGPGGFSVIADFEAKGPLGDEMGHEIMTWSPDKNAYTVVTVGNSFPGTVMGTGKWEGANLAIESSFDAGGKTIHMRAVYANPTEKSVHIDEYYQGKDGAWQLMWKGDAVK
ncbi:MAG TPA: DUF1579 family protein [Verrucomicrobiae bacterium]|nr:DUF1579 family protein [Verrucomicrobiae bacterium]